MILNILGAILLIMGGMYAGHKLSTTDAIIITVLTIVGSKLLWL